jgi:hypothetical protein
MKKEFHETVKQDGLKFDASNHSICNVKILGFKSLNNRLYTPEAVREALPLYENIKVNIDHPEDPAGVRSLRDRIGKLVNVTMASDGLRGDLIFNPSHPLAESVKWFAEHEPDCLGLSHSAIGDGEVDDKGCFTVSRIEAVRSCDLVADPATTKSLFEHCEDCEKETMDQENDIEQMPGEEGFADHLCNAVTAIIKDGSMDMSEKKKKLMSCLKLMDEQPAEEAEDEDQEEQPAEEGDGSDREGDKPEDEPEWSQRGDECVRELRHSKDRQVQTLVKAYHRLERENAARKLCEQSHIPATEVFIESLVRAGNERNMKSLIEDRKAIVNKPRSSGRYPEPQISTEEFARRLKA